VKHEALFTTHYDCFNEKHEATNLISSRNFQRRRTVDSGVDDQWQADLIDLPYPKMLNDGHTFMLIVVEKS